MQYSESLTAEVRALITCMKTCSLEVKRTELEELVKKGIDWKLFLRMAEWNRVFSLCYSSLTEMKFNLIPADISKYMLRQYQFSKARAEFQVIELVKLIELFEKNNIEVIPFKGPVLSKLLYGDKTARQSFDLDFLLPEKNIFDVKAFLMDNGFSSSIDFTGVREKAYLKSYGELCLTKTPGKLIVELHSTITPPFFSFPLTVENLWNNLACTEFSEQAIRALPLEKLFICLCAHASRHRWEKLLWIVDIGKFLTVNNVDWDCVFKEAKKHRALNMVHTGCCLAESLLGVELPFKDKINHSARKKTEKINTHIPQCFSEMTGFSENGIQTALYHILSKDTFLNKLRYCIKLCTTPNHEDISIIALPEILFPAYMVIRPFRLMIKHGKNLAKFIFSNAIKAINFRT